MADVIDGVICTVLLNGLLGLGAYLVARHAFRQPSGLPRALAAAVLAWAWATLGMLALGSLGGFSRGPLTAWAAVLALMGVILSRRSAESLELPDQKDLGDPRWRWEATLAMGLTVWATMNFGLRSLWLPVKVMSDGPIYHLWFAARWWQEGRLFLVAAPFGESVATYFPCGGDLWFGWLMVGWGNEMLAKVGQLPFLFLNCLAIHGTCRRLGVGATASSIAVGWFATITPLQVFNAEANVDTIFSAGYLLAVYFLVRYGTGGGRAEIFLASLSAGLCWGTKPSGLVFVPPLLMVAGAVVLARKDRLRTKLGDLALLSTGTVAMSGWWYAANGLRTGNPLYPLQVDLMGRRLLTGWYGRDVMQRSSYFIDPGDLDALIDMVLQVFTARLFPIWLLALGGAWAIGRRRTNSGGSTAWWIAGLALLAMANVAIYWLGIPYRTQQRFLFHAAAVAAVPLGALLDRFRWLSVFGALLLGLHVLTPSAWPWTANAVPWDRSPLVPSALPALVILPLSVSEWRMAINGVLGAPGNLEMVRLALVVLAPLVLGALSFVCAAAAARAIRGPSRRTRIELAGASAALLLVGSLLFYPWGASRAVRFFPFFPDYYAGWLALDRVVGPDGARIAYAGTNLPYYLLGPGMKNRVRYVNVDGNREWLMHDYHLQAVARGEPNWPDPRPEWDRLAPDYQSWLENLGADSIELLVVARHNRDEPWPLERFWAEENPNLFRPAYGEQEGDPLFRIYRIGGRPGGSTRK